MKKQKVFLVAILCMLMISLLGITASAAYYEPDGSSSTEYEVSSSEANRTLIVKCVDESGNLIKKVTFKCKHGDDSYISLSLYGYDIVAFSSDQGLLETCKITWCSGTGQCTNAYVQIRYYFRTSLSADTMTATVTMRKSESIDLVVRHYTQSSPGSNKYSLNSSTSQTIDYYDYVTTSKKTITGHNLKDGYASSISGKFSWTWVGKYKNMPSSPSCYSYDYKNTGWSDDMDEYSSYKESKDGKMNYCINRVCNIDYYYDLMEYTITYDANGGTGAPASQTKYYGTDLALTTSIPTRSGYTFKGWGTSSGSTSPSYQPGGKYTSNSSRTLYAIWEYNAPKTYTITYNANGGTGAPASQTKTHNVTLNMRTAIPRRSGYTFLGWSTSSSATTATYSAGDNFTTNADTTLYAVWQKDAVTTYTISYDANGGSGAPASQTKTHDVKLDLRTAIPRRSGYTFLGWSTSSTATTPTYYGGGIYTTNASAILYAVWSYNEPIVYTITFDANGGSGAPSPVTKIDGVTLYLPSDEPTRINYDFLGWSTSSTATIPTYYPGGSFTQNADTTLYAVWEYDPETYHVYYNANGGSGEPSSQIKTYGVSLTLSSVIPTRSGYDFLGWSVSGTATSATYAPGDSYTANASVTLYAVWEKTNYDFSISNLTVSNSEPYKYDQITIQVRTDSWDRVNAYSNISVQLYYDGRLVSTQYVDFSVYGIANITFTLNVGSSVGNKTIEARINWADHNSETRTGNNTVSTTINVQDYDYEVTVDPVISGGTYCEDMEVISSFYVANNSDYDIIPSMHNTARFTAYYYNGSQKVTITTQDWDDVVIPAGGTNLVYFKWTVPAGLNGKNVYMECTVNADRYMNETNYNNNTASFSTTVSTVTDSQTPDTRFESEAPDSYQSASTPSVSTNKATWTMWEYENGSFVLKKYGIQISSTSPTVTPSADCTTAVYENEKWTMGSGYGIEMSYAPSISTASGYSRPDSDAYTSVQYVIARFPEYRYYDSTGNYRTLEYVNGAYRFVENPDADGNARVHFIPVYVKDGNYTVSVTATHVWTPAGMIEATRNSNVIIIDGTIYDDWYQG